MQFCDRCGEAIVSALGHFPHVNCQPQSDLPRICADLHAALAAERQRAERYRQLYDERKIAAYDAVLRAEQAEAELAAIEQALADGEITTVGAAFESTASAVAETIAALRQAEAERDRLKEEHEAAVRLLESGGIDHCLDVHGCRNVNNYVNNYGRDWLVAVKAAALAACEQGGKETAGGKE